ncbi:hypothetical protein BDP67DRAFT_251674 [Colletotrichum lupini]|nr:hypothetical protein BDP67DRAFT_251674 [Colletotrichum lupini]
MKVFTRISFPFPHYIPSCPIPPFLKLISPRPCALKNRGYSQTCKKTIARCDCHLQNRGFDYEEFSFFSGEQDISQSRVLTRTSRVAKSWKESRVSQILLPKARENVACLDLFFPDSTSSLEGGRVVSRRSDYPFPVTQNVFFFGGHVDFVIFYGCLCTEAMSRRGIQAAGLNNSYRGMKCREIPCQVSVRRRCFHDGYSEHIGVSAFFCYFLSFSLIVASKTSSSIP